ncbi:MAG: hypothetical protein LBD59_03740 [Prevotellaceae bacterium]|jgi:hypothetical protein|nr:hypothetical protein [Prevotellaceae bacterium]
MDKQHCEKCGTDNLLSTKYCIGCGYELLKPVIKPARNKLKKKQPLAIIIGIVAGATLSANMPAIINKYFSKKDLIDKALVEYANEYNKSLPMMLDADTRMDNIIVLPNKTIMYNYTLIIADIKQYMPDTLSIKEYMIPRCINIGKTSPDMKMFREKDINQRYYYKDKNGAYIFSFTITSDQIK